MTLVINGMIFGARIKSGAWVAWQVWDIHLGDVHITGIFGLTDGLHVISTVCTLGFGMILSS